MTEPTLAMILRHACELYGCSTGQARCLDTAEAGRARAAFLWLARELTAHSDAAAGLYVGLGQADAGRVVAAVDQEMAGAAPLREIFEEAAIELVAEARIRHRLGRMQADKAPLDIARQVIAGGATAMTVGVAHLAHLASAFVALTEEVAALRVQLARCEARPPVPAPEDPRVRSLVAAAIAFNQAVYTPGERGARAELDHAITAFSQPEPSHAH